MVEFQSVFHISMGTSAVIPVFHSVGTISANILALFLLPRFGTRTSAWLASALAVTGLAIVTFSFGLVSLCVGILFVAMAFALTLTSFSTVLSHMPVEQQLFSRFHAFFGLGGFAAPVLVRIGLELGWGFRQVYGVMLVFAVVYLLMTVRYPISDWRTEKPQLKRLLGMTRPAILLISLVLGFYTISEMATIIWSGNFLQWKLDWPVTDSAALLSLYWLVFALSRFFGDRFLHRHSPLKTAVFMGAATVLFMLLYIHGPEQTTPLAFLLIALCIATVFPAVHLMLNQLSTPEVRSSLNALIFLAVSTAGLFGIPAVGMVAEWNMYWGMTLLAVPVTILITVLLIRSRLFTGCSSLDA